MGESELEALRRLVTLCPVGLVEVDDAGTVRRSNPAAHRLLAPMLGGSDPEALTAVPARLRVSPGERVVMRPDPQADAELEVRAVRAGPGRVILVLLEVPGAARAPRRGDEPARHLREFVSATIAYRQAAAGALGVSAAGAAALEELLDRGPRTPSALARWLGLSGTTVTAIVDQLQERGLVKRVRNPRDRRSVHVTLTPSGRERVAPLLDLLVGGVDRALGPGRGEDVTSLLGALTSVLRTRAAQHRGAASRQHSP